MNIPRIFKQYGVQNRIVVMEMRHYEHGVAIFPHSVAHDEPVFLARKWFRTFFDMSVAALWALLRHDQKAGGRSFSPAALPPHPPLTDMFMKVSKYRALSMLYPWIDVREVSPNHRPIVYVYLKYRELGITKRGNRIQRTINNGQCSIDEFIAEHFWCGFFSNSCIRIHPTYFSSIPPLMQSYIYYKRRGFVPTETVEYIATIEPCLK